VAHQADHYRAFLLVMIGEAGASTDILGAPVPAPALAGKPRLHLAPKRAARACAHTQALL